MPRTAFLPGSRHGSTRTWDRFGFFRPYGSDRGGAGIEPWHLSYAPVAHEAMEALSLSVLRAAIAGSDMLGKQVVLDRLPEIYTRFILAIDPPVAWASRNDRIRLRREPALRARQPDHARFAG